MIGNGTKTKENEDLKDNTLSSREILREKLTKLKNRMTQWLNISENKYLIIFSILSFATSVVFLFLGLTKKMEYNLAIGLFTSFFTTAFTVFFVNIFLNYRQEIEWRSVKKIIYSKIAVETSDLFSCMLSLTEKKIEENLFKLSLVMENDSAHRKKMILYKLKEIKERDPIVLSPVALQVLQTDKPFRDILTNVKNKIADIQVKYANNLKDAKVAEELIRIHDSLSVLDYFGQLSKNVLIISEFIKKYGDNPVFKAIMTPKNSDVELTEKNLPTFFEEAANSLVIVFVFTQINSIYKLWQLGVQFDILMT
jgi:hypothetical protein